MSALSIQRDASYSGWLRGYRIFVDGEAHGAVRSNSIRTVDVPPGRHDVQLRMDWSSSPVVAVDVGDAGAVLACGPGARCGGWSLLSLACPVEASIWLRPQPS